MGRVLDALTWLQIRPAPARTICQVGVHCRLQDVAFNLSLSFARGTPSGHRQLQALLRGCRAGVIELSVLTRATAPRTLRAVSPPETAAVAGEIADLLGEERAG
jgi:hypothetical protein